MIFVLSPSTIRNPEALRIVTIPKQVFGRGFSFVPRDPLTSRAFWRMVLEQSLTRYVLALAPFPAAMLLWPNLALPISQAPVLMFGIVLYIENNVLSVSTPSKRRALIDADVAAGRLDLLRARTRKILIAIAARRDQTEGTLHLVIEQSAMARVTPFTVLSLQYQGARPELLDPDPEETAWLREAIFDDDLTEADLHLVNLSQNVFVRDLPFETRGVSAHARLRARAEAAPVSVRG